MNGKTNKNNLGYLGSDFQYRLIHAFIEDPNFFKDLESVIDQNMFTETSLRQVVGVMKDYFNKHRCVPKYEMIKIGLNSRALSDDDIQFNCEIVDKIQKETTEGQDEIKDLAEKFFKQQNWVRVANKIKEIAGDGSIDRYDECMDLINNAMSIGRSNSDISNPYDNIDDDLSRENVTTIPTGIEFLDEILGGGLDKGKLGLIIGSSGFGKTSLTTCMAANAAIYKCENNNYEGYKVLQVVFEDTHRDMHRKYFGKITQIETADLNSNAETTQDAKIKLESYVNKDLIKNNIKILRKKSGSTTIREIEKDFNKLANEGFKADIIIIDYFECLEHEGNQRDSEWTLEGKTMRKIENMAKEYDIAIWTPVQGNRDSINAELVTMDKAGGSIKKIQIGQVVISITRSLEDIEQQRATLSVLKNRSGRSGKSVPVIFNNGTCTVTCGQVMNVDDALAYIEEQNEEEENIRKNMARSVMKNIANRK